MWINDQDDKNKDVEKNEDNTNASNSYFFALSDDRSDAKNVEKNNSNHKHNDGDNDDVIAQHDGFTPVQV